MRTKIALTLSCLLLVAALGCNRAETASGEHTETIAPASPQPADTNVENDPALTQTVEIGEERSPNEGGDLRDEALAPSTDTRTTTQPPPSSTRYP